MKWPFFFLILNAADNKGKNSIGAQVTVAFRQLLTELERAENC